MTNYHIHIDAEFLFDHIEAELAALGFVRKDFLRENDGTVSYAPRHHMTLKLSEGGQFRRVFDQVEILADHGRGMTGYVEGEVIRFDETIPTKPFDPGVPIPFRLRLAPLPSGSFRETELHITFDRDRSDPGLLRAMDEMGLLPAAAAKAGWIAKIYTVQGTRADIRRIREPLVGYMKRAGGATSCTIKEERTARWWASSEDVRMPPVIDTIEMA